MRALLALVIAVAVVVALHLSMRRTAGYGGPASLSADAQEALMLEALGPDALREVDLAAAPRDLDALAMGADPTPWLITAFRRCGSISLAAFEGDWQPGEDAPDWSSATVENGRLQAGGALRFEICPVHVY